MVSLVQDNQGNFNKIPVEGTLPTPIGADNTVVASDGSAAQWETISSLLDAIFGSTRGMMLRRGSSAWEAFAKGTQYQLLNGGAADPTWGAVDLAQASAVTGALPIANGGTSGTTQATGFDNLAPTTTRGDIIYRNATVNTRLPKGASGTVLTMGADDPAWAAPAGWTLIDSGNLPAANNKDFTVTGYRLLLLKVIDASCSTATRYLRLRASTDGGSTFLTSVSGFYVEAGVLADKPDADSFFPTTTTVAAAGSTTATVQMTTQAGIATGSFTSTGVPSRVYNAAAGGLSAPINLLRLIWNSTGDFDAGTYELYGI